MSSLAIDEIEEIQEFQPLEELKLVEPRQRSAHAEDVIAIEGRFTVSF